MGSNSHGRQPFAVEPAKADEPSRFAPGRGLVLLVSALAVALLALSGFAVADSYTYDAYGRLTGVTYDDGSSVTYTYDDAGNRTAVSQSP
jgi:YD repeat-containing protein